MLDFSASVNPLGPPDSVLLTLRAALPTVRQYPDPGCVVLAERLARLHGVEPGAVVVGNGSNDLIYALARALRPRRVAIVEPTFTEYLRASLLAGARAEHWLPQGSEFQPAPFDPCGADALWLGNPNNPTGHLWDRRQLETWVAANPTVRFVVDEAFLPFVPDEAAHGLANATVRLGNLVVLRSFTKVYALPGLRLGYLVTRPELAAEVRRQTVPWSVNTLAQAAGLTALEDDGFLARTHAWLGAELPAQLHRLNALRPLLEAVPSAANFVLLRLKGMTSHEVARRLLARGMAVRDAANFVGLDDRYLRVAVRSADENRRLVETLAGICLEERRCPAPGP